MSATVVFSITAAAAATLVGLLFVAIQLTPQGVASGILLRRHAMARSTFTLFSTMFAVSLYFLVFPGGQGAAAVLIVAAAFGIFRVIRTWFPVWREMLHGKLETRIWQTIWLLLGPVGWFAYLATVGIRNLQLSANSLIDMQVGTAATFIALFVIGLRNSWDLLVEVSPIAETRQAKER